MEQGAVGGTWLIEVTVNLGHVRQTVAAVSRLCTICSTRLKNILVSALLVPLWQLYDPFPLSFQAPLFPLTCGHCPPLLLVNHHFIRESKSPPLSSSLSLSLRPIYLRSDRNFNYILDVGFFWCPRLTTSTDMPPWSWKHRSECWGKIDRRPFGKTQQ